MNKKYAEALQSPKWQKVRLRIFERDEYTCQCCDATDKTLTIHHTYYEYGLEPWEYPDDSLHTLCKECHKKYQELYRLQKRLLGRISLSGIERVCGYLSGLAAEAQYLEDESSIFLSIPDSEAALGVANALEIDIYDVIDVAIAHGNAVPFPILKQLQSESRARRRAQRTENTTPPPTE